MVPGRFRGGAGRRLRRGPRQHFEDTHRKGCGDDRRHQVDAREREQTGDHRAAKSDAAGEPVAHRPRRCCVEPSECDHFEIPPPAKISVQRQEKNEIYLKTRT